MNRSTPPSSVGNKWLRFFSFIAYALCLPGCTPSSGKAGKVIAEIAAISESELVISFDVGTLRLSPFEQVDRCVSLAKTIPSEEFLSSAEAEMRKTKDTTMLLCLARTMVAVDKTAGSKSLRRAIEWLEKNKAPFEEEDPMPKVQLIRWMKRLLDTDF